MHLHLLPLSGDATSAGTVAKKEGKLYTIKTHEASLAGMTKILSLKSHQRVKTENN